MNSTKVSLGAVQYGEQTVYTNEYFEFEFTVPGDWFVANAEEMNFMLRYGLSVLDIQEEPDNFPDANLNLFRASKFLPGIRVIDDNPSFTCTAIKGSLFPGLKTGRGYLENYKELLHTQQDKLNTEIDQDIYLRIVAGAVLHAMDITIITPEMNLHSKNFSIVRKGFALNFVGNYRTANGMETIDAIINSMHFKR